MTTTPSFGRLAGESTAYRALRDELQRAEITLKNQRERVAELRRKLPLDSAVEDYVLHEGPRDLSADGLVKEVRLSELFQDKTKALVVYQYMYGKAQTAPCPMCSLLVDSLAGGARHFDQVLNLAIVAEAKISDLRAAAKARGWHGLRFLSSAGSTFRTDFGFQNADGTQYPGISVFALGRDGKPRHFYSGSAILGEGEYRGLDLLMPLWHMLDLTPAGRGEFWPKLDYN